MGPPLRSIGLLKKEDAGEFATRVFTVAGASVGKVVVGMAELIPVVIPGEMGINSPCREHWNTWGS